jgi:hypothetical protein
MARPALYDGLEMPSRYGWMADTDPKAFQALIEIRRNMTFDERFRQFLEMTEMLLRGYEDRVRREYPQASEREVFLRAAALRLGNETVRRVYGWSPEDGTTPP